MTEVLYPSAFSQDYAYFGMPKRKASALDISATVEDPEAWGILDERVLLKNDSYLNPPRTSQSYPVEIPIQYDENQIQYQYPAMETADIPAGFSDTQNSVYITTPEHTVHAYSPEAFDMETQFGMSSVPMQHQLSHESVHYYHTPMSTASGSESIMTTTTQAFDLTGALSSYSHLQPSETKNHSDLALALQRGSANRVTKPKRQFTTAKEALFTCNEPNCGKHFKRIWNFKAHQETHNPDRPKPFKCSEASCGKTFVRRTDRERHEVCVHSKKKEFKCNLCNSMFARKDTLRRHEDDGCSKRPGFPKSKQKKRRSPKIPNREPNPTPIKVSSSRSSSRKTSSSRAQIESQLLGNRVYKSE
ncbi:hypothetical protein ABW19_dt0204959 [Dactylella cylindrospora]|nr:hypothetical protein ABW19_dt0204959 [Dactylella cylindrospora]